MTTEDIQGQLDSPPTLAPSIDPTDLFERGLRKTIPKLPRAVRFRARNALDNIEKAMMLLPIDREMASFRAITGEEEAASAVIRALQLQAYPLAEKLSVRDHRHKAALFPFIMAVRASVGAGLEKLNITLDHSKARVDFHILLEQFGIASPPGVNWAITPVEPLDIVSVLPGEDADGPGLPNRYERELRAIAEGAKLDAIRSLIEVQANARNTLLYASDGGMPKSRTTEAVLFQRKGKIVAALMLTVIILQTPTHQAMVTRGVEVLLDILGKLPPDLASA